MSKTICRFLKNFRKRNLLPLTLLFVSTVFILKTSITQYYCIPLALGLDKRNIIIQNQFQNNSCGYITWKLDPLMGLGNRMFIYAAIYGIGKYNNKTPLITELDNGLDAVFKTTIKPQILHTNFESYMCQTFYIERERGCCRFEESSLKLECRKNIIFSGYRQSWRYFANYQNDIRKEFTFVDRIAKQCESRLKTILTQYNCSDTGQCLLIGVHLRRGDFTKSFLQSIGYIPASEEYVRKAIKYFDDKFSSHFKTVIYIVTGSDPDWNYQATKNATKNQIVSVNTGAAAMDLCVLSKCNHMIITSGSFGWWAAFLSGGHVTYMKNQCTAGSKLCSFLELNDYINPEWAWTPL